MNGSDEGAAGLPRNVQLLWGLRAAGSRGPKPSRTLDEIVGAAVAVADSDGLAAVSMARVAADVGASTMALYRYVDSKDDLLLLMSDAGLGLPPAFPPRRSWRRGLDQWARAVLQVWTARPWLLQIPASGPPVGPNNLAWFDAGLGVLASTSIPEGDRTQVILALSTWVRGYVWLMADLEPGDGEVSEAASLDYGAVLGALAVGGRFPALAAVVAAGVFDEPNNPADLGGSSGNAGTKRPDDDFPEELFEMGLGLFLDGVARRVDDAGPKRAAR